MVWNTGIPGIGQKQELYILKHYFPILKPQIVILGFFMNDFYDNLYPMGIHYVYEDGPWINRYELDSNLNVKVLTPKEAYLRSYLAPRNFIEYLETSRLFSLVFDAIVGLDSFIHHSAGKKEKPYSTVGNKSSFENNSNWVKQQGLSFKLTINLLKEIQSYVSQKNSTLMLLIIPEASDLDELGENYKKAIRICRELRIECIEVIDILKKKDYTNPPDLHWTESGHKKVGELLVKRVRALLNEHEKVSSNDHDEPMRNQDIQRRLADDSCKSTAAWGT